MILYHGSNFEIESIDLDLCRKGTDFGQGFYLTPIEDQAYARAIAKVKAFGGEPVVTRWMYREDAVAKKLRMLRFDTEDLDWARFVYMNRTLEVYPENNYDIISGPVADDNLRLQFSLVRRGLLTLPELASKLSYSQPNEQYCFRSIASLEYLKKI